MKINSMKKIGFWLTLAALTCTEAVHAHSSSHHSHSDHHSNHVPPISRIERIQLLERGSVDFYTIAGDLNQVFLAENGTKLSPLTSPGLLSLVNALNGASINSIGSISFAAHDFNLLLQRLGVDVVLANNVENNLDIYALEAELYSAAFATSQATAPTLFTNLQAQGVLLADALAAAIGAPVGSENFNILQSLVAQLILADQAIIGNDFLLNFPQAVLSDSLAHFISGEIANFVVGHLINSFNLNSCGDEGL
jgi:hypothetical protein